MSGPEPSPPWGDPSAAAYLAPGPGTAPPPVSPSPFAVVGGVRRDARRVVGAALYTVAGLSAAFLVGAGLARLVLAVAGRPLEVDGTTSDAVAATALFAGLLGLGAGVLLGARARNPVDAVPRSTGRRLGLAVAAGAGTFLACVPLALADVDAMLTAVFVLVPSVVLWSARPYRRPRGRRPVEG